MFERAVAGIANYGNSVGVPTVGGDTVFDPAYADNCLVNAMCVGLLPTERVLKAQARGTGNVVFLYGATTGRDGIGGASVLASQELGEEDADKRPSVQIGDPFTGKKLIESSLELVERGLVESLQDCGAAGLASSLARDGRRRRRHRRPPRQRPAARGGDGALGDHDLGEPGADGRGRPAREPGRGRGGLRPLGARPRADRRGDRDRRAPRVLRGRARRRDPGRVSHRRGAALRGRAPAEAARRAGAAAQGPPTEHALLELLASPNIRSRAWIYRRYDQLVGSRTIRRPGLDAAVLRLRPSFRGLAVSLDGSGRIARLDPHTGGALAVLEAARNVACAGGEPLAITDCLNFGNPEKPEIAWELAEAIEGMAAACEALGIPVVSGNVSLYNETDGRSIHPTPVVGCVGLVPDVRRVPGAWREGDAIYLAGEPRALVRRLRVPGALRRLEGTPAPLDLDDRGRARPAAPRARAALLARPRRLRRRPGGRARRGCDRKRDRRRARPARRSARPLRRRRRTGGPRLERGAPVPAHRRGSGAIRSSLFRSRTCGRPTR